MKHFKGPSKQRGFIEFIALGVSLLGMAGSTSQARKGSKAQKAANEAQRKINKLKNKQAKREFLRNFRQTQAIALSSAIGQGVGLESSGVQGTLASEKTQAKLALNEFNEFDKLGAEAAAAQNRAASASFKSGVYGQVSSFASQFVKFPAKAE